MNQFCRQFGSSAAAVRVPSIKFLGKRLNIKSIEAVKKPAVSTFASASPVKVENKVVKPSIKTGSGVEFTSLSEKAWFGRPKLTLNEILAIESGGASEFNPPIAKAVSTPPKKK